MSDTSKLDFVVEIIKKNQIQLGKILEMEHNIDQQIDRLMQDEAKLDELMQDEAKLDEYLSLTGLYVIRKAKGNWIEVFEAATKAKLGTVYSEEQLKRLLKKLAAKR